MTRLLLGRYELTENRCTAEVVFPAFDIKKPLPPDEPVIIDLPRSNAA